MIDVALFVLGGGGGGGGGDATVSNLKLGASVRLFFILQ